MSFEYVYRYYDTVAQQISLTTNTVKIFPAGTPNVQAGSEALVEQGMDEIWVTGDSQFDGPAVFNDTATFNDPVTINSSLTVTGPVTFEGLVTFDQDADISVPKVYLVSTTLGTINSNPAAPTDIPYDQQEIINTNFYGHSTTVSANEITILEPGTYKIDRKNTSIRTANARSTVRYDLYLNNSLVTTGASYSYLRTQGGDPYTTTAFSTIVLTLGTSDIITTTAYVTNGTTTNVVFGGPGGETNGNTITILKI